MEKITILLVDDHRLVRDTWTDLLSREPNFKVIGSASNGEEAIVIAKEKRPRIILMDVNMTPLNGFETTKAIRKQIPGAKIIGVSMHAIPVYAKKMFQAGATGYVTKNSSREELITAIIEVNDGKKFVCDEVKNMITEHQLEETPDQPDINSLSKRELEVAKLTRDGMSSKEIALELSISLKTVEVHRYNILKKLHLKNTAALVNFINANWL